MTKTWIAPDQLADALESPKYTRHTSQLSAGPNSKKNCCLGVGCREAGVDLAEANRNPWSDSDHFWSDSDHFIFAPEVMPWLIEGDNLVESLMHLNDYRDENGRLVYNWRQHTVPLLRALKVRKKDGTLAARQHPTAQIFIDCGWHDINDHFADRGGARGLLAELRMEQAAA